MIPFAQLKQARPNPKKTMSHSNSMFTAMASIALIVAGQAAGGRAWAQTNSRVRPAREITIETRKAIEDKVDRYVRSLPEPFSGTILLAVGDTILMNKGYGMANLAFDVPNTDQTEYEIASTTKNFTAVLVLQMAEKGLIDLNATIDRYLPEFPKDKAGKITVHHLLLHQSGIPHHINGIDHYGDVQVRLFHTPDEYLKLFCDKPLEHEPGKGTTYSTPGYFVLGMILEKVGGKSYAELVEDNILEPLGMTNTFVGNNRTVRRNMATGYMKGLDGLVLADVEDMSNRLGAGDMISNAEDLYRFLQAMNLEGDGLLSQKYKELLFKPQARFGRVGMAYVGGLSSEGSKENRLTVLGIGEASSFGFRARTTKLMEADAYYVVLSNVQSDLAMGQGMYDFLQTVLLGQVGGTAEQKEKPTPPAEKTTAVAIDAKSLNVCKGFYQKDTNTFITIVSDGKQLSRQLLEIYWGFPRVLNDELIPVGNSTWAVKGQKGLEYHFAQGASNGTVHIEIVINGRTRGRAELVEPVEGLNLAEFQGNYGSVERQKAYQLAVENGQLSISGFPVPGKTVLTPLKKDLFGCSHGFLTFHRYDDGQIRDFQFAAQHVETFAGLFIKK